ncbi:hypothetical protein [Streptomyces sp. ODS28]|uniref:hypothetical protein n=1 Tax=Streptomyces sp. ODS28 TaxID=3136688 RepID=UPI0031EC8DAE
MAKQEAVILTKSAPAVSLHKQGVTSGLIRGNLNWTSPRALAERDVQEARGPLRRMRASARAATAGEAALDLGCMIRRTDGTKTVVQALGNAFGAEASPTSHWTRTTGPARGRRERTW